METIKCYKWQFINDIAIERYFYSESEKECRERIKKTYRCNDDDFKIISMQIRDYNSNKLIKEVFV